MKHILMPVLLLLLVLPLAVLLTWLLLPLWNWLERASGIESVGHSGPANWCYWVTLAVVVCLMGGLAMMIRRGRK